MINNTAQPGIRIIGGHCSPYLEAKALVPTRLLNRIKSLVFIAADGLSLFSPLCLLQQGGANYQRSCLGSMGLGDDCSLSFFRRFCNGFRVKTILNFSRANQFQLQNWCHASVLNRTEFYHPGNIPYKSSRSRIYYQSLVSSMYRQ